jgi:phytoene dehydrogenase-like protein
MSDLTSPTWDAVVVGGGHNGLTSAAYLAPPRTPIEGFYFCGAATHPAGSVIGLNGRNAADAVIADTAT